MPFYYDLVRSTTTNGTTLTESTHLWVKTAAEQETLGFAAIYVSARSATAGGGTVRLKDNTGTTASGGTGQTPTPKNRRGNPSAQSTWANDASAITPGVTLTVRGSIGFAQTGGNGGWIAVEPAAKVQMQPNTTNPVDCEITSIAVGTSIPIDITVEFGEGM